MNEYGEPTFTVFSDMSDRFPVICSARPKRNNGYVISKNNLGAVLYECLMELLNFTCFHMYGETP